MRNRQPTEELHAAITALHAAIASEPEPSDKAQLGGALRTLLTVQAGNAKQEKAGPGSAAGQ